MLQINTLQEKIEDNNQIETVIDLSTPNKDFEEWASTLNLREIHNALRYFYYLQNY